MSGWHPRVYRRFRVIPGGVTLNLTNRGVSTSIGARGAHVTVGRCGIRQTVGLPGSGMYLTKHTPWRQPRSGSPSASPSLVGTAIGGFLRGIMLVVGLVLAAAVLFSLAPH
jgi:hypothetical protein